MLRATLKSVLSRKLRLVLSGLAVVLGVMFVSGAFVLTDTLGRSFDSLFAGVYAGTDVAVTAKPAVAGVDSGERPTNLPADLVAKVRSVPGVATATGVAQADGARVIGGNGKVVTTMGAPRLGTNWTGTSDLVQLREGRGPQAADEIAVNAALAKAAGIKVGDRVGVLTLQPKKTFTLVGIFGYSGDRDSIGGSMFVAFTEPVAQELMLGAKGTYSSIDVTAAPGQSPEKVRDAVRAEVGGGYEVKTGKELQAATVDSFRQGLSFFNNILLGFAGVALFVGVFLILNTFSIIVAQRTRELALMRAVGASRRQMIGAVLVEAAAIGLVASVVGLAAGIGVGAGLAYVFGHVGGTDLPLASIGVPAAAVIGAFGVGLVVTLVAALLPALRASRIPPVAALQEAATPDRPLTKITVAGGLMSAAGATVGGYGLSGKAGDSTMWLIMAGVLVSFIGVALLTPVLARPVVSVLGRLFSWSVPGKLGRLNSGRNPRRTAITAAALMVGLALITGVNVILSSVTATLHKQGDTLVKADLIVSGEQMAEMPPTFDPAVLDKMRGIPGVRDVAGEYYDRATLNGQGWGVDVVTDLPAMARMFPLNAKEGSIGPLGPDQLAIDEAHAKILNLHAGSTVTVQLSRGAPHTMTVAAVLAKNDVFNSIMLSPSVVGDLRVPQPSWAYVRVVPGADVAAVRAQIDRLLADSPEVNVTDRSGYIQQQTKQFDAVLMMIQVLLALAILIAVLGIVNTLALSVLERTRELGLLRAIGLRRGQVMRMVTVESVVISVFGALLGLAVGCGLGAAVVRALRSEGITSLALPWSQMGVYLVLAGVVGVVAAVLPAVRAARINVLGAIAHE
ncbi:ABC transporter permease [Planosporangium mesophilum]|uniref:Membrane protein n=1 Tax=Planosporangium mesophilum TaxID=689768 RepID=A0A8J3X340_9ACTN|nr:FtsX-like permease family protein [Planosporangium mesophilum]NJC83080.1 FtsX-like permease family protein [Planosporangium mesophilum]GII22488.1 membrane protein [Planosporangium mesophilum]